MTTVPANEHLSALLATYQYAEKMFSQLVAEVVAAEMRRDEAEKFKIEAFKRLQKARERYNADATTHDMAQGNYTEGKLQNLAGHSHNMEIDPKRDTRKQQVNQDISRNDPVHSNGGRRSPKSSPRRNSENIQSSPVLPKEPSIPAADQELLSPRKPIKQTIAQEARGNKGPRSPTSPSNKDKKSKVEFPTHVKSPITPADQEILSPRRSIRATIAESNAAKTVPPEPPISPFETNGERRATFSPDTRASAVGSESNRGAGSSHDRAQKEGSRRKNRSIVVSLKAYKEPKPTLQISRGRSREWLDENVDYEAFGLVKNFYQAAFGTKTNEKAQRITTRTIVLSDETNDLVSDTGKIQEMYVVKNTNDTSDGTEGTLSQRNRAAHALVDPPQSHPFALFFAPKKTLSTSDIYYVGHWKVQDGKILDPPEMVNGYLRQAMAKFSFAGVDKNIVDAFNRDV